MNITAIQKRFNIVLAKCSSNEYLKHATWNDVAHEVFKRYGHSKQAIRKAMKVHREEQAVRVEIEGRVIYWPVGADVDRLVDMYFEVFDPSNNHYFDIKETSVDAGDVVMDCGACEGYFTRKALESGASKVFCIEPGGSIARCLEKSFAAEVLDGRVAIHPYLVGDVNRTVPFHENPLDPTVCAICDDEENASGNCTERREMVTVDEFCRRQQLETLNFIKVDVEGGEMGLVYGAAEALKRWRPKMAIAVYHGPDNANLIVDYVMGLGLGYRIKIKGIVDFDGVPRPVMVHAIPPNESCTGD